MRKDRFVEIEYGHPRAFNKKMTSREQRRLLKKLNENFSKKNYFINFKVPRFKK